MTTITIVLLILKAFELIPIHWWMCFIPTMIDLGFGLIAFILYLVSIWNDL